MFLHFVNFWNIADSEDDLSEVGATPLQDSLPKYKLKADFLTEAGSSVRGQSEDDFIETPVLDPIRSQEIIEGLTSDQAEATLAYFLSCGDRLSQMTKTYHDVEAVTRLLEEKENDLELAAKIGQELLERNRRLEERVAYLEVRRWFFSVMAFGISPKFYSEVVWSYFSSF